MGLGRTELGADVGWGSPKDHSGWMIAPMDLTAQMISGVKLGWFNALVNIF